MKKIFGLMIIFLIFFGSTQVNAENKTIETENIVNFFKSRLEKTNNGKELIEILDKKISQMTKRQLEDIFNYLNYTLDSYKGNSVDLAKYLKNKSELTLKTGNYNKSLETYKDINYFFEFNFTKELKITKVNNLSNLQLYSLYLTGDGKYKNNNLYHNIFINKGNFKDEKSFRDATKKYLEENFSIKSENIINKVNGKKYEALRFLHNEKLMEVYFYIDENNIHSIEYIYENQEYFERNIRYDFNKFLESFKVRGNYIKYSQENKSNEIINSQVDNLIKTFENEYFKFSYENKNGLVINEQKENNIISLNLKEDENPSIIGFSASKIENGSYEESLIKIIENLKLVYKNINYEKGYFGGIEGIKVNILFSGMDFKFYLFPSKDKKYIYRVGKSGNNQFLEKIEKSYTIKK